MPSLFMVSGYKVYFWSNENGEPIHVHVQKENHHQMLLNNQKQLEITNRETAPLFHIEKRKSDDGVNLEYYIKNDKGIASYVTFSKYANFSFQYQGEFYKTRLYFSNEDDIENNEEEQRWIFRTVVQDYDESSALEMVKSYLHEKTGEDIWVNGDISLELSFIDYKNDKFNFYFSEFEDKIKLTQTNVNEFYSSYTHNMTYILRSEEQLENTIKNLIDSVL